MRTHHSRAAFTLLEILTVIAVVAFLLALVLGTSVYARRAGREGKTRAEIEKLSFGLQTYWLKNGSYPASLAAVSNSLSAGLTYSNSFVLDPWGRPYEYTPALQSYDLRSAGQDGIGTNADDIVSGR